MTGTYLIAGYGAYLDSDMASELALASHLAEEGKLISGTWVYSTEVRVLSTQLIFTPLMALFPHDWRLVRTLGCLILQGILAVSAYFCGRALGADKKFSLLFAGLSISACSVVYAQMVTIGAYYVPHAVLTNLCVGMTARLMRMEKGKKRAALGALLLAMCVLMGASSIRYPFCATIPVAAAGLWAYIFPSGGESAPRTRAQGARTMLTLAVCAVSVAGFAVGQSILSRVCLYDAARYGGVRLASFLDADMTLKAARENQSDVLRFGALTLAMSAAITALSFVLLEGLYLNRYWIPLMTLGAPVMAACLTGETNAPFRRGCALLFAGVVLTASAMQITSTMKHPEITDVQRERAAFLQESGLTFGYATFWNANVITELTNGEVEAVGITIAQNEKGQGVPRVSEWLEAQENRRMERPDERVFMLLTEAESERLDDFLTQSGAQARYTRDGMTAYEIESQRIFFETAQAMDTP